MPSRPASSLVFVLLAAALLSAPLARGQAGREDADGRQASAKPATREWALAIHGGAGTIPRTYTAERRAAYIAGLEAALKEGREMLAAGRSSLDVVEAVVRRMEDNPLFNAGKGAVFSHAGKNELDAAIMDGKTLACGSVAGVTTIRNPVSLARAVMEKSPHVFLVGAGAEEFAASLPAIEKVAPEYFFTEERWKQLQDALAREKAEQKAGALFPAPPGAERYGTVGAVALDKSGNLAAATSTGGMTNKRWGRIGDVPVIGAGTYADKNVAISCTGYGEQFIRHGVAHAVAALHEYAGMGLEPAAAEVIHKRLEKGDGGLIAVGRDGTIVLEFNSDGMYRGAADSSGRFETAIWESP
jgi:beta-aspartyl-peptidase (threonine type)